MNIKILALSISLLSFQACADFNTNSGYPSGNYPNNTGYPNQYPQYPNNNYPNNYPNGGYYPPVNNYPNGGYNPPAPNYDCRYYGNCPGTNYKPPRVRNNNHNHGNHGHNNHQNRPNKPPPRIVTPPLSVGTNISPSCPSGTVFTGRTCKITDNRLKKPGRDGNINPCPKGMWISNGKCIGK